MSGRLLMTGGSGFVGSYLAEYLFRGHEIVALGRKEVAGSEHVFWEISDGPPSLAGKFAGVIHCAGQAHMRPRSQAERDRFYKINTEGTRFLLEALDQLKEVPSAFVYLSTVAVYGLECGEDITEESPLLARSPYGGSKIEAEKLVIGWGISRGVPVLVLRLPLVVGRDAPGNLGSMVDAIRRRRFPQIGKGDALRSMVLLTDVAEHFNGMLGKSGVYNLTDGRGATYEELGTVIADWYGLPKPLRLPKPVPWCAAMALEALAKVTGRRMPFGTELYRKLTSTLTFSCESARRDLGWRPRHVIEHPNDWLG